MTEQSSPPTAPAAGKLIRRAAIYCRVSDERSQGQNYSLPTQLAECQKYCDKQGYSVVATFAEKFTGTTLIRPELDQLRELARGGGIDVVVCLDIDRLGRDLLDQLILEDEITGYGATIEYALTEYGDTIEGKLQKDLRRTFAEFEKRKFAERSARGKIGYAKSGKVTANRVAPYGYCYISKAQGVPHYEIDDDEAEVIRLIFDLFLVHKFSLCRVADELTARRIPTRYDTVERERQREKPLKIKGYGVWHRSTVHNILCSELYAGVAYYNKTRIVWDKSPDGTRKRHAVARPRSEWIAIPVAPIVDRETWEQARKQCQRNTATAPRHNNVNSYLMRGVMTCSECSMALRGKGSTGDQRGLRYYCGGNLRDNARDGRTLMCHGSLRAGLVDDRAWQAIVDFLTVPTNVANGFNELARQTQKAATTIQRRERAARKELKEAEQAKDLALDRYLKGKLSEDKLDELDTAYDATIAKLRDELSAITTPQKSPVTTDQIEVLRQAVAGITDNLDNLDFAGRHRLVEMLDIRGVIQRGETRDDDVLILRGVIMPERLVPLNQNAIASTTSIPSIR